jgi:Flp pilus assembly protein TadG
MTRHPMTVTSKSDRLLRNGRGNVAIITALTAIPLLIASGVAIDAARSSRSQNALQVAVDSAALAVAASDKVDMALAEMRGNPRDKSKKVPSIEIYTIAFQAPEASQTLLKSCATSAGYFIDAANGTQLKGPVHSHRCSSQDHVSEQVTPSITSGSLRTCGAFPLETPLFSCVPPLRS